MASGKKQHYVPQFYLRSFSEDRVHLNYFLLKNRSHYETTIDHTYQEKFFYGADGTVESRLQTFEAEQSKVIKKVLTTADIGQLSIVEYQYFLSFIQIQLTRTIEAKEKVEQFSDYFIENVAKPTVISKGIEAGISQKYLEGLVIENVGGFSWQIWDAATSILIISDLKPVLLKAPTGHYFITSDNPVVKNNYNFSKTIPLTGTASPGLQIFAPLNPNLCLLLIDNEHTS